MAVVDKFIKIRVLLFSHLVWTPAGIMANIK